MKKTIILLAFVLGYAFSFAQYTLEDQIYDYIDAYKDLAMQEMELYKVPASITLAQAIYSSKAGTNRVAREANNHFGITCHGNEWNGETYYETDNHSDDYCFRKYASVAASYRDHSLFLSQRSRYVKLFYYPITDYKIWAQGLKEAGYSGNPRYADTLISIIEKYFLMHYDRKVAQKLGDTLALKAVQKPQPAAPATATVTTPVAKSEPVAQVAQPKAEPSQPKTEPSQPKAEPSQPKQPEPAKPAVKSDTMEVNGIEVIVEKPVKKPEAQPKQPVQEPVRQPEPETPASTSTPMPEKVNGLNVFVLDPYTVPYKSAYYPYTSRPVYENNKTKFILARAGDTYQKLAASLQLTEKNLRLYNDVYDGSEPIEDEVIYLEQKSTKSTVKYHTLQEGDTYRYIAQRYGIQLKILIKRNSGNINSYGVGDQICIGCN